MGNVHAQMLCLVSRGSGPDLCEYLAVGEDLACMEDEQAQQGVLGGRKLHVLASSLDDASSEIDLEIAALEDGLGALRLTVAQGGAHPREQLASGEWFGHVIIRA